jgi:NhaP-type Na+/H+ or K+/H+ antiporter
MMAEPLVAVALVILLFGAVMVPGAIGSFSGAAFVYAVLSLSVVRMVPVALSLLGSGLRAPSVAFLGWFGPRGLASILFALVVVEEGRLTSGPLLEGVVVLTVLLSAVMHGATAYPLARRYAACAAAREPAEAAEESMDIPVRVRHAES